MESQIRYSTVPNVICKVRNKISALNTNVLRAKCKRSDGVLSDAEDESSHIGNTITQSLLHNEP